MIDKTGGPAFPTKSFDVQRMCETHEEGMTLRDYFAAKAVQGYIAQGKSYDFADIAAVSYRIADAMLKARES